MEAHDVGEVVAVLAAQVVEQLAPGPHVGQPLGRLVDRFTSGADVGREIVELGEQVAEALGCILERSPPVEVAEGDTEPVAGAAVVDQCGEGGDGSLAVGDGIGEYRLLAVEQLVLVGVADARGVELGDLEAEQVDLPRPGPLVAAERGEFGIDLGDRAASGAQRSQVDPAEACRGQPAGSPPTSNDWWAC